MMTRRLRRLAIGPTLCSLVVVAVTTVSARGEQGGRGGAPVRDNVADTAIGTGEISGVVVLGGGGAPVRRARVLLSGAELRGARTAISDDQGRFVFQFLPAGQFSITASKAGYIDMAYGAKRPGRPGTPIRLADGQRLDRLSIVMPRGGVITGAVVDENGEPAPGTQVRALRYVLRTGERSLVFAGQDQTDDRGSYRIFGLQPGEYVLSAVPRNLNPASEVRQQIASQAAALQESLQAAGAPAGRGFMLGNLANSPAAAQALEQLLAAQQLAAADPQQVAYAPVYYPGTTTPSGAATIALGVSEERSGVDFQLQLVATATVQGTVVSPGGALPEGTQIALVSADLAGVPAGMGTTMARADGNGQFTFRDVTPGQYTIQSRAVVRRADAPGTGRGGRGGRGPVPPNQIAQVLWASADVAVAGHDVADLQLLLQPGMTVAGRIEFRGGTTPPPDDLTNLRLTLTPRGQQPLGAGNIPPAEVDDFGRFTIRGVTPGRYSLSGGLTQGGGGGGGRGGRGAAAVNITGPWTLSSVMVDGRDVLDFPLDLAPNQTIQDALVTFSDRTQELAGRIEDASGRPTADFTIVVFPGDSRYWLPQSRRIAATRPGTDGSFSFRALPAGDYRLTAVTDVEPGEWYDPAFLSQLVAVSIPITVREGEQKVQNIRVAN